MRKRLHIFFGSLAIAFVMASLQYLMLRGVLPMFSPRHVFSQATLSQKPQDILSEIRPKLEVKKNSFVLYGAMDEKNELALQAISGANAYMVINVDSGDILTAKDAEKKLPIASLTKIMTAVVALDLASLSDTFIASEKAAGTPPTIMGVERGEALSLQTLLHGLLLTSANDAAKVIQEGIDSKYGADVFVKAMNMKASFLGLAETSFDNPAGFDGERNYATAKDLAILTKYALSTYPFIAETVQKDYQFLEREISGRTFDLYNWNGLLGVYPGIYGVKIGNTDEAGRTTIVVSERVAPDGTKKNMLAVLLGAPGIIERDLWAAALLDFGFGKLGLQNINVTEEDLRKKYATWKYFN